MDEMFAIIAQLGLELHPDRIGSIFEKIEILGAKERLTSGKVKFRPKEYEGSLSHDSVKSLRFIPPSVIFYEWLRGQPGSEESSAGVVHAKCAVADEKITFITSANLTAAVMERDMELGVVVKGGELPRTLHRHLEAASSGKLIFSESSENFIGYRR
jgi:phosphatidylserine/phosphatidylglycerophosphate/cardiolipin synthase-like enzyme